MNRRELDILDRELQAQSDALLRPLSVRVLETRFAAQLIDAVSREARQSKIRGATRSILRLGGGIAAAVVLLVMWRSNPPAHGASVSREEFAGSVTRLEDWLAAADATTERLSRITDDQVLLLDDDGSPSVDELLERVDDSLKSFDALLGA